MQPIDLEHYLHEHIPLSGAMQVRVVSANLQCVRLSAPLAPNINHRATVFGGSASALALLAAWTLLYVRLKSQGLSARLVIQRNNMAYEKPMAAGFSAAACVPEGVVWEKFIRMLQRKGRARIEVMARLECQGEKAGELRGEFVAISL